MANVLILSDLLVPTLNENKRGTTESILYRTTLKQHIALGSAPCATLLGPVIIGSCLKNRGHQVQLLECAFHPLQRDQLTSELKKSYKYILLSSTFIELEIQLAKCASIIRELSPDSILIMGGSTLLTNIEARKIPDFFILGEGEVALSDLIESLENGIAFPQIPGVGRWHRDVEYLTPSKLLSDLDSIPHPDWSLVKRNYGEYFSIYTQRGCHWRCAFCTYPANEGFKLRFRSIESVIDEIVDNYNKFGIFRYVISDSTFSYPQDRFKKLLDAFQMLPFKIEWIAYARVDDIDEEVAQKLSSSGCRGLYFGCESGDKEILKKMNKQFTPEHIIRAAELLHQHKITFTASWIIGFPGETDESVKNTWDMIKILGAPENVVHIYSVLGNSPVSMRLDKFGIEGSKLNWQHTSMSSHRAKLWTDWIVKKMLLEGIHLGSTFDRAWLKSVQFNDDEIANFFNLCEEVNFYKARFHKRQHSRRLTCASQEEAENQLSLICDKIWKMGKEHPMRAISYRGETQ